MNVYAITRAERSQEAFSICKLRPPFYCLQTAQFQCWLTLSLSSFFKILCTCQRRVPNYWWKFENWKLKLYNECNFFCRVFIPTFFLLSCASNTWGATRYLGENPIVFRFGWLISTVNSVKFGALFRDLYISIELLCWKHRSIMETCLNFGWFDISSWLDIRT